MIVFYDGPEMETLYLTWKWFMKKKTHTHFYHRMLNSILYYSLYFFDEPYVESVHYVRLVMLDIIENKKFDKSEIISCGSHHCQHEEVSGSFISYLQRAVWRVSVSSVQETHFPVSSLLFSHILLCSSQTHPFDCVGTAGSYLLLRRQAEQLSQSPANNTSFSFFWFHSGSDFFSTSLILTHQKWKLQGGLYKKRLWRDIASSSSPSEPPSSMMKIRVSKGALTVRCWCTVKFGTKEIGLLSEITYNQSPSLRYLQCCRHQIYVMKLFQSSLFHGRLSLVCSKIIYANLSPEEREIINKTCKRVN